MVKKKICFVTAVPVTASAFLRDHMNALHQEYEVYYVSSEKDINKINIIYDSYQCIHIERGISLIKDLKSVWCLYRYFRKMKFDAVHSVTPKAGLVTALAAYLARVPHRTHIFTGQVWATQKGFIRWLLKSIDKIIARLDNHIMVDGKPQRAFLEQEGVLKVGRAEVFHNGSISGVNSKRFSPDIETRKKIRNEVGIKDNQLCFIFLGRLNHDKGIGEIYEAYNKLAAERADIYLLFVGFDEERYIKRLTDYSNIKQGKNFYFYGSTPKPEKVLNAGDVFVLPTYREGFGTSVLEAASVGLPSICSDAYGVIDAYVDGETGLKCHVGDADSLYNCMKKMCDNPNLVKEMGKKSRERVLRDFKGEDLTKCWVDFYHRILS